MMPGKVCILVFNYSVHNQFLTLMNTINLCWSDLRTVLYMYMIQSGRNVARVRAIHTRKFVRVLYMKHDCNIVFEL